MFNFDIEDVSFSVSDAPENMDNWIVKKSEVISYVKEEVIVKSFEEEFPHIKILGSDDTEKFNFITKLVSRNENLFEWYSLKKLSYSELAQLPSYLEGVCEPKNFLALQDKVSNVNQVISKYSGLKAAAAEEYRIKLNKINSEMEKEVKNIKGDDKILKVLTLTSQSLPLSMASAIERYNSADSSYDLATTKRLYARELLTSFKVSLLKLIKDNPDLDLDKVIDGISLK